MCWLYLGESVTYETKSDEAHLQDKGIASTLQCWIVKFRAVILAADLPALKQRWAL